MVNYDRRKREPDPFTEGSVQRDKLRVLDTDSSSKKDKGVLKGHGKQEPLDLKHLTKYFAIFHATILNKQTLS